MKFGSFLALLVTISLSGCFSMHVSDMQDTQWEFHGLPFKEDDIVAIGQIADNQSEPNRKVSVALIGKNGTYLVEEGSEELLKIAKTPGAAVVIVKQSPQSLFASGTKFWGKVELTTPRSLSIDEALRAKLEAVGFTRSSADKNPHYERSVTLSGTIAPPIDITPPTDTVLSTPRKIHFYRPKNEPAPHNYKKSLLFPFAVVGDVVTAPIQILGLTTLWIIIEANGGIKVIR